MPLKEDLIAAGLDEAQAKTAEGVLKTYIAGEYIPKHRFDEVNAKSKELAAELVRVETEKTEVERRAKKAEEGLAPLQQELENTSKLWEQKYNDLVETYKREEEDREILDTYNRRLGAIKTGLGDSSYDSDMVVSLIDFDSLKIEDGNVFGVKEALDALKKEKPFLFKPEQSMTSTAPVSAPKKETSKVSFGELLAKKKEEADSLTEAATKKYFG